MKKLTDIREYAEAIKKLRGSFRAEKCAGVMARIGREGEEVATYVANGTLETVNRVKRDENGDLDVVVTTTDAEGHVIVYGDGRTNVHLIPRAKFDRKYRRDGEEVNTERELYFRPAAGIQEFVRIDEDISFIAAWGEEQVLKAESFLNITDPGDIYGISYEEFVQTYRAVKSE